MAGLQSDFSHSMQCRKNLGNDEARMLGGVKAPGEKRPRWGQRSAEVQAEEDRRAC